ncbi:usg protein [Sphingomonas sp. OTU376]|uniref:usg protein n=1 Tax=Sphingomonas sp. OTU376 TaxID=3043863 RepID=UPI00313B0678
MTDSAFIAQLDGYGLTTAEIHYHRPDAPSLLQLFVWQQYDLAPGFPALFDFLDHWRREIRAAVHSVRIMHDRLLRPAEWCAVDGVFKIR